MQTSEAAKLVGGLFSHYPGRNLDESVLTWWVQRFTKLDPAAAYEAILTCVEHEVHPPSWATYRGYYRGAQKRLAPVEGLPQLASGERPPTDEDLANFREAYNRVLCHTDAVDSGQKGGDE